MRFIARTKLLLAGLLAVFFSLPAAGSSLAEEPGQAFQSWLAELRQDALAQGISQVTLDAALTDLRPIERVVELDRRQPEFVDTFINYLDRRVTEQRIQTGKAQLQANADLLHEINGKYGVPPQYLVAFWGLETNFGATKGNHPTIAALATLAFDGRRSNFFRNELLEALGILDAGHITPDAMRGSWAGAMGHMQFMPSTFRDYAVDADGDGRKDLWGNLSDALASGANFLSRLGWKSDELWGREVRLPENFDLRQARLGNIKTVDAWAALGVRRADGRRLPRSRMEGAIVLPQGHAGPAFLVYDNFRRILAWNRSVNYALAVGLLADRMLGGPDLYARDGLDHRRLSSDQALAIQTVLSQQGLYEGELDGMLGSRTKDAIQLYQQQHGLPADGYPSVSLLEHMQSQGLSIKAASTPQSALSTAGHQPI